MAPDIEYDSYFIIFVIRTDKAEIRNSRVIDRIRVLIRPIIPCYCTYRLGE